MNNARPYDLRAQKTRYSMLVRFAKLAIQQLEPRRSMAYWTAPGRAPEGTQDSRHNRSSSPQCSHERMHAWLVGPNLSVGESWRDAYTVLEDRADRP